MTITNMMTVACCVVLLLASGENGIAAERAGTTGKAPAPVPDDRLLPLGFQGADCPTFEQVLKRFHEYHHQESEKIRNADGSWGEGYGEAVKPPIHHPLVRDTARRVLGYIDAHIATGKAIYKERAKGGLEHLLEIQQPDGQFIWWYGDPEKGRTGGGDSLYVTGIPTVALLEGYKLFQDKRYLAAADKACDYMCGRSNSRNANYNLFAAWGLAANYETTKKKAYLDRATEFALHAIGKTGSGRQLPSGGWSDHHNQAIWYHAIILRGLATLLSVMPDDHPHRTEIQKATYKALNHLRSRQTATGGWLQRPGDEAGEVLAHPLHALGVITIRLDWPVTGSLDLAAKGVIDPERKVSSENRNDELRGQYIMAMGSLLRAYKHLKPADGSNTPPPPAAHSAGREMPGPGPAQSLATAARGF